MKTIGMGALLLLVLVCSASAQYMYVDVGSATPNSGSGYYITESVKFDASTINNDWYTLYIGTGNPAVSNANACQVAYSSYSGLFEIESDDGKTAYHPGSDGKMANSACMLFTGANGVAGNGSNYTAVTSNVAQLTWNIQFSSYFVGKTVNMYAYGAISGCQTVPADCSGWQKIGTYTITALTYTPPAFLGMLPQTPPNWDLNYVPITDYQFFSPTSAPPGVTATLAICATLTDPKTGVVRPDIGADLRPVVLDPTPGAYYHYEDTTGLGRPNITIVSGDYITGADGCIHLPLGTNTADITLQNKTPEFAGEYWVAATNISRGTVILVLLQIGDFEFTMEPMNLGYNGWAGLNGTWTYSDSLHHNDIGQTSPQMAGKVYGIGNRLVELEPVLTGVNAPAGNKIGIFRFGLGLGGTHDFPGSGSQYFATYNTDKHGGGTGGQFSVGGRVVDISNLYITGSAGARFTLGLRETQAISAMGCSVTPAKYQNGSINQSSLEVASVWHVSACSGF